MLAAFWRHSGGILTAFWRHSDRILAAFWRHSDRILTAFWRHSGNICFESDYRYCFFLLFLDFWFQFVCFCLNQIMMNCRKNVFIEHLNAKF
jgi:hypothetical protein